MIGEPWNQPFTNLIGFIRSSKKQLVDHHFQTHTSKLLVYSKPQKRRPQKWETWKYEAHVLTNIPWFHTFSPSFWSHKSNRFLQLPTTLFASPSLQLPRSLPGMKPPETKAATLMPPSKLLYLPAGDGSPQWQISYESVTAKKRSDGRGE